jgi:hypothetical protein
MAIAQPHAPIRRKAARSAVLPDERSSKSFERPAHDKWACLFFYAIFFLLPVNEVYPLVVIATCPAMIVAIALLLLQPRTSWRWLTTGNIGFSLPILTLAVTATASYGANLTNELGSLGMYVSGYLSMIIIYMAIRCFSPTERQWSNAIAVFSVAAMAPLCLGLFQVYQAVGVPAVDQILRLRYSHELDGYREVTWGNVTATNAFLALALPIFLALALDKSSTRTARSWYSFCTMIGVLNVLVVSCRSYFFVFPVHVLINLYVLRHRINLLWATLVLIPILALGISYINADDGKLLDHMASAMDINNGGRSITERMASIREGFELLNDYPFLGVGPGRCTKYIFTVPHQLFLYVGAELGFIGMLAIGILFFQVCYKLARLALLQRMTPHAWRSFVCVLGAFSYLAVGVIANVPTGLGPWLISLAALLALSDTGEIARRPSIPQRKSTTCFDRDLVRRRPSHLNGRVGIDGPTTNSLSRKC